MWGGCRLLFASLLVSTIAETLCVLCMPKAFCVLEMCAKRLSELCALCERKNLYEVCKQPNRGNLTYHAPPCGGGVGGGATSSWARNCAQKGSVNSVRSVREKTPQRVVCVLYHTVGAFYFSQMNTEEQISQRPTETLSQPITQNLTATEVSPHCPTRFKNMPFSIWEHALQRPRTRPSWCLIRPFFIVVCNILILCRLQRWMKHTYWTEI